MDADDGYREIAGGGEIPIGAGSLSRSPLFVAGGTAHALFVFDSDIGSRLSVRLRQRVGDGDWEDVPTIGAGGGSRTLADRGQGRRLSHYMEFELPAATASRLRFDYRAGNADATEESEIR